MFNQVLLKKGYNFKFNFDPKVILDLGANIGLTAVYYKSIFPNAVVIAVEPEINNFSVMEKNLRSYKNVITLNTAVWSSRDYLKIVKDNVKEWSFQVKKAGEHSKDSFRAMDITTILKYSKQDYLDVLKIDVEGTEKELFSKNYHKWLSKTRLLIVEPHERYQPGCTKQILRVAGEYGYLVDRIGEHLILYRQGDLSGS